METKLVFVCALFSMCLFAFIENIATRGLSAVIQGTPVSFYSRRMGIIYTCIQGHSPHIYHTSMTGVSQDALTTLEPVV